MRNRAVIVLTGVLLASCGGNAASSAPTSPTGAASSPAASKPAASASVASSTAAKPGGSAAASISSAASASGLTPFKIAYSQPTSGFVHLWMAQDKGYFKKYGLDAQVLQITPPTDTSALINGEIQVDFDGSAGINAISSGAPIPFVAITNPTFTQAFYSQPSLQKLGDIVGKTVAVTTRGGSSDVAFHQLLARENIDINKVNVTYLRDDSAILAALQSGQVQAAMLTSPNTLRAGQAGMRELVDMSKSRWHTINQGANVKNDWAKQHEDLLLAFMKGELEGMRDAKTDPASTKQAITKWTQVTDPALLDEAYRSGNAGWAANPLAHDEDIQGVIDYATEASVKTHKPSDFYDNSYLNKLQDFIKGLYPQGVPDIGAGA